MANEQKKYFSGTIEQGKQKTYYNLLQKNKKQQLQPPLSIIFTAILNKPGFKLFQMRQRKSDNQSIKIN